MTVLVVALTVAVALLGVLVAGLLRSHAEILRSLHELGAGREDTARAGPVDVPFQVREGVLGPAGVTGTAAADVAGHTPDGDAVQLGVVTGQPTLLAFLSSGCLTCHGFWERFAAGAPLGLPGRTRLVVVTQGDERESASAVARLAGPDLVVVMSTPTWERYEVPGSPYFVLVDGVTGTVTGEGSATTWEQVGRLVSEAAGDRELGLQRHAEDRGDGAYREARADRELHAAGITPGHPSLQLTADEVAGSVRVED